MILSLPPYRVITHPAFLRDPPFKSLEQFEAYRDHMLMEDFQSGWLLKWIEVKHGDVPGLPHDFVLRGPFFYRDVLCLLCEQFSNPDYQDHFVMRAKEQFTDTGIR